MSRTLFVYLFRDLLRVFLLASGAIAGIMSFGGLLRPLTEHGLDGSQVVRVLSYFMPAMTTYSLPIAALFATTFVYGRLGSDNELTACRASGMSYTAILLPGVVLGLLVASVNLLLLCFVVPAASLRVERVVFGNIARLVANQIDRTSRLPLNTGRGGATLHARDARVLTPGVADLAMGEQAVKLHDVLIMTHRPPTPGRPSARRPDEIYTASAAVAYFSLAPPTDVTDVVTDVDAEPGIRPAATRDVRPTVRVSLQDGFRFPHVVRTDPDDPDGRTAVAAGIGSTQFGPFTIDSPVREKTKFMDIRRLHALLDTPEDGRLVRGVIDDFIFADQQATYLKGLAERLRRDRSVRLDAAVAGGTTYTLSLTSAAVTAEVDVRGHRLWLGVSSGAVPAAGPAVRLTQWSGGRRVLDATAEAARVRAIPSHGEDRLGVTLELLTAEVSADGAIGSAGVADGFTPGDAAGRLNFERLVPVAMPPDVTAIADRGAGDYLLDTTKSPRQQRSLRRALIRQGNGVVSEIHARLSFSVSCLVLVLVGGSLGLLLRSGNFLTAFAASITPAMVAVVLIVSGQQVAENVPWEIQPGFRNPLTLGLWLIWSGNLAVLALGLMLLRRLSRA